MALFPISPRHAKMLITGQHQDCLPYVVAIVSALSVGDPFVMDYQLDSVQLDDSDGAGSDGDHDVRRLELNQLRNQAMAEKEGKKLQRRRYYSVQKTHAGLDPSSDILKILNVVGAYEFAGATEKFCADNFLRPKVRSLDICSFSRILLLIIIIDACYF